MLPTGENSDSEEEEDYPEPNASATFAKAKFARIQATIQKKTSRLDIEPRPTRTRAGQVITSTHQRLIDAAILCKKMTSVVCPTWSQMMMNREAKMSYHDLRYKMIA